MTRTFPSGQMNLVDALAVAMREKERTSQVNEQHCEHVLKRSGPSLVEQIFVKLEQNPCLTYSALRRATSGTVPEHQFKLAIDTCVKDGLIAFDSDSRTFSLKQY